VNVKGIILLPFIQVSGKKTILFFIAEMSSKGVPTTSISLKNQNFNWSLKPITILMAVLGQEMVSIRNEFIGQNAPENSKLRIFSNIPFCIGNFDSLLGKCN